MTTDLLYKNAVSALKMILDENMVKTMDSITVKQETAMYSEEKTHKVKWKTLTQK